MPETTPYYVEEGMDCQWRDGETRRVRFVVSLVRSPRVVFAAVETDGGWLPLDDADALGDLVDRLEGDELLQRLDDWRHADAAAREAVLFERAKLATALPGWAEAMTVSEDPRRA